ncbi:putative EF-hand domain-containing protein [Helianthus anomalus]
MVDLDRSGFIDAKELQQALISAYQKFSIRTICLLMFQFRNPLDPFRTGMYIRLLTNICVHERLPNHILCSFVKKMNLFVFDYV